MEPLKRAEFIIAGDHVAVGHVVAEAESGFVLLLLGGLEDHLVATVGSERHSAGLGSSVLGVV